MTASQWPPTFRRSAPLNSAASIVPSTLDGLPPRPIILPAMPSDQLVADVLAFNAVLAEGGEQADADNCFG